MTYSVTLPQFEPSPTNQFITEAIARLRQLSQFDVQPQWWISQVPQSIAEAMQLEQPEWAIASLNARHHISWAKGQQVLWLRQSITVPQTPYPLEGLSLKLAMTWWAESAEIYVNGVRVQQGDLFDCSARILLSPAVEVGDRVEVVLRLVSPGHDDGALVRSVCVYELESDPVAPEPGFVADELAVIQCFLNAFCPEQLAELKTAIAQLDWATVAQRDTFQTAIAQLRQQLMPFSDRIRHHCIHLLGHAHLDLAWLWPISDTWVAAERTFKSVLYLQHDFPELIFGHSSPALYAWIEEHRPALFEAIQQQIREGLWEVIAGLWVEPEFNTVSGESIVRQVLYGQRYVLERFGQTSTIAWLPDSFGFCWQLPQIFKQGGIDYFVTQKLRWNDTNPFPHQLFEWRSPDGTTILSLHSAPIGEGIDPIKMAAYVCQWEQSTKCVDSLWLPGVGDHGGGPTQDMLETARRWQQSPFFPRLQFSSAHDFLQNLTDQTKSDRPQLPVWDDELYLEFHRGCYTSHADQKRWNRRCEQVLVQAELFAAIAHWVSNSPYPHTELETAWKQVLFNQFHDILPGSAIPDVFAEANEQWQQVAQTGETVLQQSLEAIAQQIQPGSAPIPDAQPIIVFNSLAWERTELVAIAIEPPSTGQQWCVVDAAGHPLLMQHEMQDNQPMLRFQTTAIPGMGYCTYWLTLCLEQTNPTPAPDEFVLENAHLRVVLNPQTGTIQSLFDKVNQQQVLSAPGNQLQAFHDAGQYWDAWNIDPNYAQHPLPDPTCVQVRWLNRGAVQQRVQVVYELGRSRLTQDYVLDVDSAVLKIETWVDWQETHIILKAAFPLTVQASEASYEMPFGTIQRPTHTNTPQAAAKWEVPALHWADLSDASYGVSLLNDCKYGYDCTPDQVRLTLLRSPQWPDPNADRGHHRFTYAVYPHAAGWAAAQTVQRGYELNYPLLALRPARQDANSQLPRQGEFLTLPSDSLVFSALKRSEANADQWILRCYESKGRAANLSIADLVTSLNRVLGESTHVEAVYGVDGLERSLTPNLLHEPSIAIPPWTIASWAIQLAHSNRSPVSG